MWTKIEVKIFNGKAIFFLWQKKTRVVLIQMKVTKAIYNTYAIGTSYNKNIEIDDFPMSTIMLHLFDNVLHKVDKVKTTYQL